MLLFSSLKNMNKIFFLFLISFSVHAQSMDLLSFTEEKPKINYIKIRDRYLVKYLENYISRHAAGNELFGKGLGFVVIDSISMSIRGGRPLNMLGGETEENRSKLNLNIMVYPLIDDDSGDCVLCNLFPPYYTVILNKVVLIYEDNTMALMGREAMNDTHNSHWYDKESKERLIQLIKSKALFELPGSYIFDDLMGESVGHDELKSRLRNKLDVFKYYEFIDFKAKERIYFDSERRDWRRF